MKALLRWCARATRGVAAVEFAITFPILLFFMGGVTDFGIVYYRQSCLSTAVAAGAQYASLTDQAAQATPPGPALTMANIQTVMSNAAGQAMPGLAVTATATNPALCYCITGSSPNSTLTSANCNTTCSSGGNAGKYVQLTQTHTYTPILPALSNLVGAQTLTKTAWVPLQ